MSTYEKKSQTRIYYCTSWALTLLHRECGSSNYTSALTTPDGVKAWDTFMTLAATTRKLGVSFYTYVHDRILGEHTVPPLADLIAACAIDVHLGESWDTS
jgi:hypothetical protein